MSQELSVLEYLQREIEGRDGAVEQRLCQRLRARAPGDEGRLDPASTTHMRYPTPISRLLGMRILAVEPGCASIGLQADAAVHGNQQGTVHGGLLSELADAAIGTAHSTLVEPGDSFTSIDLRISFFRPVWQSALVARAWPVQSGRTVTHYQCEILREDGKTAALAGGTIMTLRGTAAAGR